MALLHRDRHDERQHERQDEMVGDERVAERVEEPTTTVVDERERVVRRNSVGQTLRTALATLLLAAVVAVAVANTDDVAVDLLFTDETAPLVVVIAVTAAVGFVIGALAVWRSRRPTV